MSQESHPQQPISAPLDSMSQSQHVPHVPPQYGMSQPNQPPLVTGPGASQPSTVHQPVHGGPPQLQSPMPPPHQFPADNIHMLQRTVNSMQDKEPSYGGQYGGPNVPMQSSLPPMNVQRSGKPTSHSPSPSTPPTGVSPGPHMGPPMAMSSGGYPSSYHSSVGGHMGPPTPQIQQSGSMQPSTGANSEGEHYGERSAPLNPIQAHQLKNQIMAYRLLARNQGIPEHIQMGVQGKRFPSPQMSPGQNSTAMPPSMSQIGYSRTQGN